MSDEEVILSNMTFDDKELLDAVNEGEEVEEEEPSIYDPPTIAISSLSPTTRRLGTSSSLSNSLMLSSSSGVSTSHRSMRYNHNVPSRSTALKIAEEEASNFYESEVRCSNFWSEI
jgi:hypothetical protein